jgi:hypothetical protein
MGSGLPAGEVKNASYAGKVIILVSADGVKRWESRETNLDMFPIKKGSQQLPE